MRDLNPEGGDWLHDAIEWIGEALEHIGASAQFESKTCIVDVKNHKAMLPADFSYPEQIGLNKSSEAAVMESRIDELSAQLKEFAEVYKTKKEEIASRMQDYDDISMGVGYVQPSVVYGQLTPGIFKALKTTDSNVNKALAQAQALYSEYANFGSPSMMMLPVCTGSFKNHCPECDNIEGHCYFMEMDMIKTSFPEGKLCMAYKAFPTDADCYPLVPDDVSFREAMFWYIYKKMLLGGTIDVNKNGINYGFADQQWKYYCSQARNSAVFPDIDKYESFMNQWVRLIPNINRHAAGFKDLANREDLDRGRYNTYGG